MVEIAHGLDVHYEKQMNYVFFADRSCKSYPLGGMLFELLWSSFFVTFVTKKIRWIVAWIIPSLLCM